MDDLDPTLPKLKTLGRTPTLGKPKLMDRTPTMGSAKSKVDHMARRKSDGLSHRQIAGEFGISKSTSHRMLKDRLVDQDFDKDKD